MINGMFVVDSVVHPYDMGEANNGTDPNQQRQIAGMYHHHRLYTGEQKTEYLMERDEFISDFDLDGLTGALFAESQTDMGVLHALPNLGFSQGPLTDIRKMAALRDANPGRFLLYATINTRDTDAAIRELEWQVREFHVDGLKLYPAFYYDGKSIGWRLNDPDFATPLLEAARDLGLKNIAIHKAIPIGPSSIENFKVSDIDEPLMRFRDLNFQLVHAGFAFLDETRVLLHRHPNLYANLESTFCNLNNRPAIFLEALGEFLYWGSVDQILYASGFNITHPRPMIEAFAALEMPQRLKEERGYPDLTDEIKRKILGLNALKLHGIDPGAAATKIAGDQYEQRRAHDLEKPWTSLRQKEAA
ncbi:amidohydrolase family protein [Actinoplanes bogorensis]|uniref:Amidohydrolase family protein n=1 Tax=Paractinoplanes bogorensis TaxID=1610840 RepID=A0ABS5YUR4_9ACTN|nr:amidohydrolase family protein [Actinoplanes bogorensis]MBU2667194.1 amidohydrolase family protein [Actinoplanes bogorensis]